MTFPMPTFSPTVATGGDPYFSNVKLLLGFEGADASTDAARRVGFCQD